MDISCDPLVIAYSMKTQRLGMATEFRAACDRKRVTNISTTSLDYNSESGKP